MTLSITITKYCSQQTVIQSVIMLSVAASVITMSVITMSVIILNVVAPLVELYFDALHNQQKVTKNLVKIKKIFFKNIVYLVELCISVSMH